MNENKIHKEDNYENCREPCGQIVHLKHNMDMSVRESCQLNLLCMVWIFIPQHESDQYGYT